MLYVIIILMIFLSLSLVYICLLIKEIRSITRQLERFSRDETAQKLKLELFNKDLNRLAVRISEQMENNIQANIEKYNAQQELRRAIANMSHDLRTPLTSILGYIQFLKDGGLSEDDKKDYILSMHDRALRLQTLINDFFELSVIDSYEHILEGKPINLTSIVKETLLSHYETLSKRKSEPVLSGIDKAYMILGDEAAVYRVVENLLSNALKYSLGDIEVGLYERGNHVEFCVSNDTGSLSEQDLQRIFDRFYTADKTRSGKGNGLGMPIVKGLMQKMGGEVFAQLKGEKLTIICKWLKPG